ncbi:uncharacterized protein [Montipora capricornis]|uniref:uncharacterized protein n=1 Tax=Montipora capricornis TaxID=246305 RepID=UPI0035F1E8E9
MHIHKAELTRVLARAGTPYSAANFSTLCSGINGASDDFRSNFGKSQRELSIKIPREAVNKDHLKTIDSWFCIEQDDIEEIEDNDCNTCEGCQKLSHEIALLKTKMREREDRIHQEYDEKIGALKERVLEERERSEQELLSAKKTIEQLKMELAQTKKVEKQLDGPVVTSSLAKITEGECLLPGNACGVLSPYMWSNPSFFTAKKSQILKKYILKIHVHLLKRFSLHHSFHCFFLDLPSDKSINDSGFLDADDAERQSSSQSAETRRGKKRKGTAVCSICPSIKRSNMLQCNSCKQWQHSKCAGITAKDYDINYVCQICKEKK